VNYLGIYVFFIRDEKFYLENYWYVKENADAFHGEARSGILFPFFSVHFTKYFICFLCIIINLVNIPVGYLFAP